MKEVDKHVKMSHQHVFMSWTFIGIGLTSESTKAIFDNAIFAKPLECYKVEDISEQNDMQNRFWDFLFNFLDNKRRFINNPVAKMQNCIDQIDNYQMPNENIGITELMKQIDERSTITKESWLWHIQITVLCSDFPTIMMLVIEKDISSLFRW